MVRTADDDAEKEICENETEEDMDITGAQDAANNPFTDISPSQNESPQTGEDNSDLKGTNYNTEQLLQPEEEITHDKHCEQ